MATNLVAPLVQVVGESRRPFESVKAGDLVTVNVYNPETGEMDQEAGASVTRIAHGSVFIRIAGLTAPYPYHIGDRLVIDRKQVIDW